MVLGGAPQSRPFPLWPTAAAACAVIAVAFLAAILIGIPTVIAFGSPRNPGDLGANLIEAAFYLGGAAALIPFLERLSHRSLAGLGVRPMHAKDWGFVASALILILTLQVVYQLILGAFHQQNHVQAGFANFRVRSPEGAVMVLLNGAVIAPIVEELFFRGLLFNAFATRMPIVVAAFISGALFGVAHGDPVLFPVLMLFGVMQALFYRLSGNLVVPMLVHGANNALFLSLMMTVPGFH